MAFHRIVTADALVVPVYPERVKMLVINTTLTLLSDALPSFWRSAATDGYARLPLPFALPFDGC
jgi:hypothetical protein